MSGNVNPTLSLTVNGAAVFAPMIPGVANDYLASVGATVTSTAGNATLSVADPSSVATGYLVNESRPLATPLNVMATNAAQPTSVFAPVTGSANPLTLLTYAKEIANDAVTVTFRQRISATEGLRSGSYSKTLTFTLSTTMP